ncbi:hypothetical protein HPP92_020229 [Vanilla planifolia]|uniref:Uncharacterized protein n=1 Tax=Vanilla planifolia TaxID=51239 RepID=A0A835Q4P1_VANPL|nr:hypothetical protein HPP92_020229 [Vanilla planifolia]
MEIVKRGGENDAGGELGCSAFGSAAFRIGWWIGKRVAIAGAVMTSAPILIPPLLLFSTLALALSFPFGVYFAGISCATKIMDTLFPFSESTVVERSSVSSMQTILMKLNRGKEASFVSNLLT